MTLIMWSGVYCYQLSGQDVACYKSLKLDSMFSFLMDFLIGAKIGNTDPLIFYEPVWY